MPRSRPPARTARSGASLPLSTVVHDARGQLAAGLTGPAVHSLVTHLRRHDPAAAAPDPGLLDVVLLYLGTGEDRSSAPARAWAQYAYATVTQLCGPDDPRTLTATAELGIQLETDGDYPAAIPLWQALIAAHTRRGEPAQILRMRCALSGALHAAGRCDDGVTEALAAWRMWQTLGPDDGDTEDEALPILVLAAALLRACGRATDAAPLLAHTRTILSPALQRVAPHERFTVLTRLLEVQPLGLADHPDSCTHHPHRPDQTEESDPASPAGGQVVTAGRPRGVSLDDLIGVETADRTQDRTTAAALGRGRGCGTTDRGDGGPAAGRDWPDGSHPLLDGPDWLEHLDPAALLAPLRDRAGRLPSALSDPVRWFERTFAAWVAGSTGSTAGVFGPDGRPAGQIEVTAVNRVEDAWRLCWHHHRPQPGHTELVTPMWTSLPAVLAAADAGYTIRWAPVDTSLALTRTAMLDALDDRTGAVLVTHPYGPACNTGQFRAALTDHLYGQSRWIPIIADATTACGAEHTYHRVGVPDWDGSTVFSFDRTQLYSTGAGAAVVTARYPETVDSLHEARDNTAMWCHLPAGAAPQPMSALAALIGIRQLPLLEPTIEDLQHRKQCLRRMLDDLHDTGTIRFRPQADHDGDTATDIVCYLPDTDALTRALTTLRTARIPAHPLLQPGADTDTDTGTGWAGAWTETLYAHGIQPPSEDLITAQQQLLHTGLRIPLTGIRTDEAVVDTAERLRTTLT